MTEPDGKPDPEQPQPAGGSGGILQKADNLCSDMRLIERAVKKRWPIREDARPLLMDAMTRIALDRDSRPRERIAATRALLQAEGQNQADELKTIPDEVIHQVVGAVGVRVVEVEEWYGRSNRARSEADGASIAGALESGEVQGAGVRPAVGKNNGQRVDGASGTRAEAGGL